MSNIIIIAILVIVFIVMLKSSIRHFKGEGGCCGGGGGSVKEPDKKLSGTVIKTKVFKIDGMHCENCTNRIKRGINRIDGVSAKLNLKKKQAIVQYEKEVEDETLIRVIEELGYKVISVQ